MYRRCARVGLLIASMLFATALTVGLLSLALLAVQRGNTALAAQHPIIPPREAVERTRAFVGNPELKLQAGLDETAIDPAGRPIYWLEAGDGEHVDDFRVDARSGEVLAAVFRSRLVSRPGDRPASVEDAAIIAANFGQEKHPGFRNLTLIERSEAPARAVGPIYTLKWVQLDPATGAELPISLTVSVASGNGSIVRYIAQRDPVNVNVRPTIDRERAISRGRDLVSKTSAWKDATLSSVRLQVIYDDLNRQRLAWAIVLAAPAQSAQPVLVLIDAQSGDVIGADS